ncbi:class F sortase [Lacisediminihabitans changchengi]|uniref:Class F sortase n=1 Tax=Lacisediminihabitans changchengi TaxID=2787634 RepID=A0A934SLQ2_9MICO|nr:class F sortase [Lacisediminihabitans changchengi]MBK4347014.1 class F sortase [Lacisediminihabitans changchengi]MBK4347863.1 class F sortase [Lacisediminihabitans changchengi]
MRPGEGRLVIRARWVVIGLSVAALVVGGVAISAAASPHDAPRPSASAAPGAAGGLQDPTASVAPTVAAGIVPTRVRIPAIGVDSGLEDLSLDASGALLAPADWDSAGWYSAGVVPGNVGPAVIAGHIDSPTAPAVFARLSSLKSGDTVTVTLSDGTIETFTVTQKIESPKATFPTSSVYGNVPTPQLRLITCGGVFNPSSGHYVDNLIVYASLTS